MTEISFKEFQKLDLRIGKILSANKVENSRNLIMMQVSFGSEQMQAVAGLAQHYQPEQVVGNKYMFICNLEHKKFMGTESQCMILAAEDSKGNVVLLRPETDIEEGSKVM